LNSGNQMLLRR